MIKERGGRGRARAVLINFFPFLTYIYIYDLFTRFSPFIYGFATSFFERNRREGGGSPRVSLPGKSRRVSLSPLTNGQGENVIPPAVSVTVDRADSFYFIHTLHLFTLLLDLSSFSRLSR